MIWQKTESLFVCIRRNYYIFWLRVILQISLFHGDQGPRYLIQRVTGLHECICQMPAKSVSTNVTDDDRRQTDHAGNNV